jgi:hypothetical protein
MTTDEFLTELSNCTVPFNYLQNCPYLYGVYMGELLWCPVLYLNFWKNKQALPLGDVGKAVDLLKLDEAQRIINAADGVGEFELRVKLNDILISKNVTQMVKV